MSSTVGHRHQSPAKQKVAFRKKRPGNKTTAASRPTAKLLTFTIDADTAQIVKLETLDARGAHRELSNIERADLLREGKGGRLEEVLERAFEAGIACALGYEAKQGRVEETVEDAELRHLLLARLIDHSAAKFLMDRGSLNRAIIDALIRHSRLPAAGVGADGERLEPH